MIDIVTDFSNLDNDWHYLALVDDVAPGVNAVPLARLIAGNDDDRWTVEIVSVADGLVRFKLLERVARRALAQSAEGNQMKPSLW